METRNDGEWDSEEIKAKIKVSSSFPKRLWFSFYKHFLGQLKITSLFV